MPFWNGTEIFLNYSNSRISRYPAGELSTYILVLLQSLYHLQSDESLDIAIGISFHGYIIINLNLQNKKYGIKEDKTGYYSKEPPA